MSSSASGPYQSKFFNFLNRHSLKWRDRLETTVRHLKVTVDWGVQILLYPAYLLVQAGRMAGRELEQIATRAQLSAAPADEPPPTTTSDRPLAEILSAITWSQENEPAIQGIASLLDSRRLALVTAENSLLDVLSPEQQKTLLDRIRREVANYYYERRLAEAEKQKLPGLIPDFEGEQNKILPPARWFWQVMRWVQRSPVAIATNLFGESRFRVAPEPTSKLSLHSLSPTPALVAKLDRQIAKWEIAPRATAKQLFRQIQTLSPQGIQSLVAKTIAGNRKQGTGNRGVKLDSKGNLPLPTCPSRLGGCYNSAPPANSPASCETTDPFSIQALILAAVDYFFGGRSNANYLTKQEGTSLPTHTPPSPTEIIPGIQEPDAVETAFDWLEATVTSTGYVKHPLEQILAWLDRLVLWLEQLLTKLMSRINPR